MRNWGFIATLSFLAAVPAFAQSSDSTAVESAESYVANLYRGASAGDPDWQWKLGVALDQGKGVISDPVEAVRWFREAIANGSAKAHASLALMYATGRGVAVDYSASREHYENAAKLGEPHGFFGVGILYARGEGVSQDLTEAHAWMLVAASTGDPQAVRLIKAGTFGSVTDTSHVAIRVQEIAGEFGLPDIVTGSKGLAEEGVE